MKLKSMQKKRFEILDMATGDDIYDRIGLEAPHADRCPRFLVKVGDGELRFVLALRLNLLFTTRATLEARRRLRTSQLMWETFLLYQGRIQVRLEHSLCWGSRIVCVK